MIPLRDLRRIERQLSKASALLQKHYVLGAQDWNGSADDLETSRSLDTALAHVVCWIDYRQNHRRDPYLKSD